jgi:hypothetical protein
MTLARLPELLTVYASTPDGRHCATPAGAYTNCYAMSMRFCRWLRGRDVPAAVLLLAGSRRPFPAGVGRWPLVDHTGVRHWVVQVGDVSVDWTFRQFDPAAESPRVVPVSELPADWNRVERWLCATCPPTAGDELHLDFAPPSLLAQQRRAAVATLGAGPYADPRHDNTVPMASPCRHGGDLTAQPRGGGATRCAPSPATPVAV